MTETATKREGTVAAIAGDGEICFDALHCPGCEQIDELALRLEQRREADVRHVYSMRLRIRRRLLEDLEAVETRITALGQMLADAIDYASSMRTDMRRDFIESHAGVEKRLTAIEEQLGTVVEPEPAIISLHRPIWVEEEAQ